MIAEYERTQIAERCRRGKKHMAQQGGVNVLSGALYGYRYVKKSDTSAAFYEVVDAETKVVRMVFETYTQQGLSINAIARMLNDRQIATRTGKGRWERSTVWGMLRNPAYRGTACYGKTEQRPRQRVTRPLRQRKALPSRDVGGHERPRAEWIEVPVPALVTEEMFALAQEQLEKNKRHSPRRTIEPTLLQGILVCEQCGYGLYRASTHTTKHKLNYYRCIGSDGYRRLNGPVCRNRPIRQDYLDQFVWSEVIRLLEDPGLIQTEIDRRREAAQKADPFRKREEELRREQARVERSSERLLTAYQEGLLTLTQLRQRMPALQKQTHAVESELQSLKMAAVDEAKYLQLAESLAGFRSKLRVRAEALDIAVRQQILRLLVKEVLVGVDTLTIRHSIPIPSGPGSNGASRPTSSSSGAPSASGYLLRSGSHLATAGEYLSALCVRSRFAKFGLVLHPDKTRLIQFGRFASDRRRRKGEGRPETFDFLGFTHCCGTDRKGKFQIVRLTAKKRMRTTMTVIRDALYRKRHEPVPAVGAWLKQVINGYFVSGVPTNLMRLEGFRAEVCRAWRHALLRRSQRHRLCWERFNRLTRKYVPPCRVRHPYPEERFLASRP